jgi:hypothetical protein
MIEGVRKRLKISERYRSTWGCRRQGLYKKDFAILGEAVLMYVLNQSFDSDTLHAASPLAADIYQRLLAGEQVLEPTAMEKALAEELEAIGEAQRQAQHEKVLRIFGGRSGSGGQ